jgi:hypothetical protein
MKDGEANEIVARTLMASREGAEAVGESDALVENGW